VTPALTPVDTRWEGFPGATGVSENAKTPGNPGHFDIVMLYEGGALSLSYIGKSLANAYYNHKHAHLVASEISRRTLST
jgi:hypothetical protein